MVVKRDMQPCVTIHLPSSTFDAQLKPFSARDSQSKGGYPPPTVCLSVPSLPSLLHPSSVDRDKVVKDDKRHGCDAEPVGDGGKSGIGDHVA
jgi:hypothetical protein